MAKKEELHLLIKSLSRSEKRYVKLFAPHNTDEANYMRLFDAIDGQEVYNEAKIRQKFNGEQFVKQLHVTKKYLRDMILSALRSFHASNSKDAELKQVLQNVELLFNKELYSICAAELNRAGRLADKYELVLGRIEVAAWRRKLVQATEQNDYRQIYRHVSEQVAATEMLVSNNRHWEAMVAATWQTFDAKGCPAGLKKAAAKRLKATTLESDVLKANTAYITHLSKGERKLAEQELINLIARLEQYEERLYESPAPYISTVNNLGSYLIFSKRPMEALKLINKAKNTYAHFRITTEKRSLLKQIFRTYNLELEIYRDGNAGIAPDFSFISETEKFITANKNKIPKDYLLLFWFQLAHIYFTAGNYDISIKWLNEILNNKFGKIRIDLQKHARILNLLVHFEQKNYFVLRYFTDSVRRFNKKHHVHEDFDEELCRFIIKAANTPVYEHKALFRNKVEEMFYQDEASGQPERTIDFIDYKSWMLSHSR